MRGVSKVFVAVLSALGASVGPVAAADMSGPQIISAGPTAHPTAIPHFYFGLKAGAALGGDTEIGANYGTPANVVVSSSYQLGYTYGVAVGYDFGQAFGMFGARLEVEVGSTRVKAKSHQMPGVASLSGNDAGGAIQTIYGVASGFLDLHAGPFKPYLGAGVGYARTEFDELHGMVAGAVQPITDTAGHSVAWQVGAGLGYELEEGVSLDFGYRFMGTQPIRVNSATSPSVATNVGTASHQFTVGLRYHF